MRYHAGENGLWICGGFGGVLCVGGVTTRIKPWVGTWTDDGWFCWDEGVWWLDEGGLPRDEGVCGLGTATRRGPVTERFVATRGGLCASLRLSDNLDPSDDNLDMPSGSWCCGWWGWWRRPSCGCSRGGAKPSGSGNL